MTSNVGSKVIEKGLTGGSLGIGFGGMEEPEEAEAAQYKKLKSMVHDELKNFFRPEFLNRLDEIIVFKSLTKNEVEQIAELEFRKTLSRIAEQGVTLALEEKFKEKVVD